MSVARTQFRRDAMLFGRLALVSLAAIPVALLGAAALSPAVQIDILVMLGSLSGCAVGQGATTCAAGDVSAVVTQNTVRSVAAVALAALAVAWLVLKK